MKTHAASSPRFALFLATLLLALPLLLMACSDLSAPTEVDSTPPAPAQANAAPDSVLAQSIASIDVRKGAEAVIDIKVKPGTSQDIRDQLRRQVEASQAADRVLISEASSESGAEEGAAAAPPSEALNSEALNSEALNSEALNSEALDDDLAAAIQSISVQESGRGHVRLTLRPGTPESVREQIRAQLPDTPDGPEFTITVAPAPPASPEAPRGPQASPPPTPPAPDTTALSDLDEKPEIIGGPQAIYDALEYPKAAREDDIEGTVFLQFVVTAKGEVDQIEVLKSPSEVLSRAAVRVIEKQQFVPGRKEGSPVPVRMAQPIRFQLPS